MPCSVSSCRINSRKSPGTPAGRPLFVPPGVPGTPGRCPENFSSVYYVPPKPSLCGPHCFRLWSVSCWSRVVYVNSVQTRCIVKGEAQKSPLFRRFSGGFWLSQDRLFSRNSTRKPLNLIKSLSFTNARCKSTCLYNAPSMHTVEYGFIFFQNHKKHAEYRFESAALKAQRFN